MMKSVPCAPAQGTHTNTNKPSFEERLWETHMNWDIRLIRNKHVLEKQQSGLKLNIPNHQSNNIRQLVDIILQYTFEII